MSSGEPTVSRQIDVRASVGSEAKWRRANACMPSMKDSSEPVETSSTRTPVDGLARARRRARPSSVATPVRLSLAPGTTPRAPISANGAPPRRAPGRCRRRAAPRAPSSAAGATSSGPPKTGNISGGVVSVRSSRPGKRSPTNALGAGEQEHRRVRGVVVGDEHDGAASASRSPASATTFQVGRGGSSRRRNHWRPPEMSSAIAAAANAPAASARRAAPASAPAAPASAHEQAQRPPVRPVRALLLDARRAAVLAQAPRRSTRRRGARRRRPRAGRRTRDAAHDALELGAHGDGVCGHGHRRRHDIGSPAMPERDPDCLFCKIVAGELPATIVAEDERTVSFMDINPATRGHALVVPREHAADLLGRRRGGPGGVCRRRPAPRARAPRARSAPTA